MNNMNEITLEKANISGLEIKSAVCDLHHDIAQYMAYIKNKNIKRSSRTNYLLKGDIVRLSKLMPNQQLTINDFDVDEDNYPSFIDQLAYDMDFVNYDTASYHYYDAFPDNYIKIKGNAYQKHIDLTLQEQEERILNCLNYMGSKSHNEFVSYSPIGILNHFQSYYTPDYIEKIDFRKVRLFLLELLSHLKINTWYEVKSFVQYLKFNHPYFLIPRQPEVLKAKSHLLQEELDNRYYGFSDTDKGVIHRLNSSDKNAFERVEGRYIERFLEYIPFLLGYVELGYKDDNSSNFIPTIDVLSAFRITPRFISSQNKEIQEAKIIVQPNFEITIESSIYPAKVMSQLQSIGHLVRKDVISQIKIEKHKVIQKVAKESNFDPIQYLSSISSSPLPENVKIELTEWCGHADAFILYENVSLLESNFEFLNTNQFIAQKINKKFNIIKNTEGLINELERNQTIPIKKLSHKNDKLQELSNEYKSIISKGKVPTNETSSNLEKLKIGRFNLIKLVFTTDKNIALFSNHLLERGCMINISDSEKAIIIDQKDDQILNDIFKTISNRYKLEFDNK